MKFMLRRLLRLLACLSFLIIPLTAAVIGTNPPCPPLSTGRIAALPAADQSAWRGYLARSAAAFAADKKFYADELTALALTQPLVPSRGRDVPLKQPADWYVSAEALRVADNLVSFQTPAGGWNKNTDFTTRARRPGERSGYEARYIGTIDNNATITPLRFLAGVIAANGEKPAVVPHRTAFFRGLDYLFAAQFPSGGWPQVYPLEGEYHDAITFNDGATVNVLTLLRDVATSADFAFVPPEIRARAAAAARRGLACILATQIVTADGRRTVWGQQHDPLTLAPVSARAYEMPSQSAGESAGIMRYLMTLPDPSPAVIAAVHAAAVWFERTALQDVTYALAPDGSGHQLIPTPGAPALWARYSEIGSDRPLFGDRDRSIHDQVGEISKERRAGYAWFGTAPKTALADYAKWSRAHPKK
jgi:PelA/Pel-15E family pectate lyase